MGPGEQLTTAPPLSSAPCWAGGAAGCVCALGPWASLCPLLMTSRWPPVARCRDSLPQVTWVTGVCFGEKRRKKTSTVFTLRVSWQVTPGRVKDEAGGWRACWRWAPVDA